VLSLNRDYVPTDPATISLLLLKYTFVSYINTVFLLNNRMASTQDEADMSAEEYAEKAEDEVPVCPIY